MRVSTPITGCANRMKVVGLTLIYNIAMVES